MKRLTSLSLLLIILLSSSMYFSCTNANTQKLDAVDDIMPVDVHDIGWRKQFISSLKPLTPEQRKERIDMVVPKLNSQLVENLHRIGMTCEITSITYVFGSGSADGVTSGDGNTYEDMTFTDDLYAVVKGGSCFGDSLMAFIECFNGVFRIQGENQEVIGTYQPTFTIEKGWGINRYTEYRNSIWLAEQFNLKLHEGQGWSGPIITPARARELYNQLGETAVTVEVYEGDVFNLGAMTYTHNGTVTYAKE